MWKGVTIGSIYKRPGQPHGGQCRPTLRTGLQADYPPSTNLNFLFFLLSSIFISFQPSRLWSWPAVVRQTFSSAGETQFSKCLWSEQRGCCRCGRIRWSGVSPLCSLLLFLFLPLIQSQIAKWLKKTKLASPQERNRSQRRASGSSLVYDQCTPPQSRMPWRGSARYSTFDGQLLSN